MIVQEVVWTVALFTLIGCVAVFGFWLNVYHTNDRYRDHSPERKSGTKTPVHMNHRYWTKKHER